MKVFEASGSTEKSRSYFVLISPHLGLGLLVIRLGSRIPILVLAWLWHPLFIMHTLLMFDEMLYFDLVMFFL